MAVIVALVHSDGFRSPAFEATLRAFEKHTKLEHQEVKLEEDHLDLPKVVEHLKKGDFVVVDGGKLPDETAEIETFLDNEQLDPQARNRFQVWCLLKPSG